MCGRFTLRTPMKDVADLFAFDPREAAQRQIALRYNISPTQEIAAVRAEAHAHDRHLVFLRWGLVPAWADDPSIGGRMINARAESIATKPAFRESFKRRRCLIPADGFFEWKRTPGGKQPYYIRLKSQRPFAFAGLWDFWHRGERTIESCTIITTDANDMLSDLHDRMPVMLDERAFDRWLDPASSDSQQIAPLLVPYPADAMEAFPVSTLVNSPRRDVPECIAESEPRPTQGSLFD